ncbi:MAG TPA: glycosyltransferase family 2 protein [Actinomycetota bacterium]|nr:glycosyltransferase family 2 protein [Actinomycetota bacterium]
MRPRVGVGILNYNGPSITIECLDHLSRVEWPKDRLEIVVVDNASADDSIDLIRRTHPDVRLVESPVNRGFAGGCNLAIKTLGDVDYVALLNNDAFVEPGWLEPLVEALEANPGAGAACPKILFATTYVDLRIESPQYRPVGSDSRSLGVRISGLTIDGENRFAKCHFPSGFFGEESGGANEPRFRWTDGSATMRVPLSSKERGAACRIRVSAEKPKPVVFHVGEEQFEFTTHSGPRWLTLPLRDNPFELINNCGSDLIDLRHAADRGIFQPDRGQFDETQNVFAWCGCSVLLSPSYLADVGLFDESLFLYYEDFDLSWRGQRRGWSYVYVPDSVVRHLHASTSVEHSDTFNFFVRRNRLLILLKNGSLRVAVKEARAFGSDVLAHLRVDLRAKRLSPSTGQLLKALASYLVNTPGAVVKRARSGLSNRVARTKGRVTLS